MISAKASGWLSSQKARSAKTVSYTHLDVYKRQIQPLPAELLQLRGDVYLVEKAAFRSGVAGGAVFHDLYHQRIGVADVYKRQLVALYSVQLESFGYVTLYPALAMAGAGQVGAAVAIYFKAKKCGNTRLKNVITGALQMCIRDSP